MIDIDVDNVTPATLSDKIEMDELTSLLQEETRPVDLKPERVHGDLIKEFEQTFLFPEDEPQPDQSESKPNVEDVDITPISASSCRASARGIVEVMDGMARTILPTKYVSCFFRNKFDFHKAKELKDRLKSEKEYRELTDEEAQLLDSYENYHSQIDLVPMRDDTKESIVVPLSEVIAKHGGEMTPETRLLIAVGGWALPLVFPFIGK